jgi:hypothetical protein
MLFRGWAFAFTLIPIQVAVFATIHPRDTGRATAIFNAGQQVSVSFGVAMLATALTNRFSHYGAALGNPATRSGALLAFHDAFVPAVALSALGVLLAVILIDDKLAAGTMRPVPAAAASSEPAAMGARQPDAQARDAAQPSPGDPPE